MSDFTKVKPSHTQRAAVVYIRQSSPAQVEYNRESTTRQYALLDEACQLGWAKDQVIVIDEDLSLTGSGWAKRSGFARMTAEVALGHVGIVLALEVSRVARNDADWYRLFDLCGMTDTPGSGFPFQGVKAFPQQPYCQMVEQGGELHPFPFPCCFPHTRQPLGYASLALCRVRAGLMSVLLDQRPSLPSLRQRFPVFVQLVHRYYSAVRPLDDVHARRTAFAFSRRPAVLSPGRHPRRLRVLVHEVSGRAWGLRLRRAVR